MKTLQKQHKVNNHSPSQQTSVDKREVVHTKKTSDAGENPVSDTLHLNDKMKKQNKQENGE